MRFKLLLIVGTIALLIFGGQSIFEGISFHEQKTISYADFVRQKPTHGWFKITGCAFDLVDAIVETRKDKIETVYLPIYDPRSAPGMGKDGKTPVAPVTQLVLETEDPGFIQMLQEMQEIEHDKSESRADAFMKANLSSIHQERDLEGMLQNGLEAQEKTRTEIAGMDRSLASDYLILRDNKRPNLLAGVGMFVGGIILALLQLAYYGSRIASRR